MFRRTRSRSTAPVKKKQAYGMIPIYRRKDGGWRVLLVQHANGHWAFPYGYPQPGEPAMYTAARELIDDTGVSSCDIRSDVRFVEQRRSQERDIPITKQVTFFLCYIYKPHPQPSTKTINATEIMSFKKASQLLTHKQERTILDEARKYLSRREAEMRPA